MSLGSARGRATNPARDTSRRGAGRVGDNGGWYDIALPFDRGVVRPASAVPRPIAVGANRNEAKRQDFVRTNVSIVVLGTVDGSGRRSA